MGNTPARSAAGSFGYPKKNSVKDLNQKSKRKSRLATNRRQVHEAVRIRERGRCAICKWNAGTDYHHVYGRSPDASDWKESADAGLWVCRACHPHGSLANKGDDPALETILEECINGTRFPNWMQPIDG
jgi:hypothetical protein